MQQLHATSVKLVLCHTVAPLAMRIQIINKSEMAVQRVAKQYW